MSAEPRCEPGKFYWVKPVFDVDFVPPGFEDQPYSDERFEAAWNHWSQGTQPALFLGLTEDGEEKWVYLGQEEASGHPDPWWPVCWIGSEIKQMMTTKNSPVRQIKTQADKIAAMLKAAERGEALNVPHAEKIMLARANPSIKVGIVMDNKVLTPEIPWATIRALTESELSAWIVSQMREIRP